MITARRSDGDKGSSVFTFEKSSNTGTLLTLTKTVKGWVLELPKITITESSSNMMQIQELAEALNRVAQIVETDGFNLSNLRVLPAKGQPQINTVGTAVKEPKSKKAK